ncbi:MAG: hypothetical protein J7M34_10555 [Anaerolineae bacterium]|nr:hypothetical protein [Anaerolineae bacterium]
MEPRVINLGGPGWSFGHVPPRPFSGGPSNDLSRVETWYSASVPGNVRTDLLALGLIPDPFVADQYQDSLWVEEVDWWYRRPLFYELRPGQRAFLIFRGIDYLSEVWIDGHRLGCHEGMFSPCRYEITPYLRGGAATLAVRIWGSHALPRYRPRGFDRLWAPVARRLQPGMPAYPDRMATTKCQMSFGWDFAPPIRTMGIWDDVTLHVSGSASLVDVWAHARPLREDGDPTPASLRLQLTIDSARPQRVQAVARVFEAEGDEICRRTVPLSLSPGVGVYTVVCNLPPVPRWWPWDQGGPHLLRAELALRDDRERCLDRASVRFGVRAVSWEPTDGATAADGRWRLRVNGRDTFIRGANWVPVDVFPGRVGIAEYRRLIEQARSAGINLLRVWGGGLREKRAFYDLCDEQGMLVWQEFPLACAFLDRFPWDRRYLAQLEQEARAIVCSLRSHPSLVLWCGGNEFNPRRNRLAVGRVARAVAEEDGTRRFVPASPGPGDVHQWMVWHGGAPISWYTRRSYPMLSEFGLQAPPGRESLERFLPSEALWPPGRLWRLHHAELKKLWRYARPFICGEGLDAFVAAAQRAQAYGLQVAIEHVRRHRGRTGGCILWQFNEPWPAISWSVLAHDGTPKLAYDLLRRIYQPLLVSLAPVPGDPARAEVWITNDGPGAYSGCRVVCALGDRAIWEAVWDVQPLCSARVGVLDIALGEGDVHIELWRGANRLAWNAYGVGFFTKGRIGLWPALKQFIAARILS